MMPLLFRAATLILIGAALLTTGCQSKSSGRTGPESSEREVEKLKEQHRMEMENRDPPAKR